MTPWASIAHALQLIPSGHTIRIKPGTYAGALGSKYANVRLRADGPAGSVVVQTPAGQTALAVAHHDLVIEGIAFVGGTHAIRAENADGLAIRSCTASGQTAGGFTVVATSGVIIENSVAAATGARGIHLDHSGSAYVRNNLVYGPSEWGIDFENADDGDPMTPPLSTGNVVAFNTVARGGGAAGTGGIRLKNAIGEVRDNLLFDNVPIGLRIDTAGASVHQPGRPLIKRLTFAARTGPPAGRLPRTTTT